MAHHARASHPLLLLLLLLVVVVVVQPVVLVVPLLLLPGHVDWIWVETVGVGGVGDERHGSRMGIPLAGRLGVGE